MSGYPSPPPDFVNVIELFSRIKFRGDPLRLGPLPPHIAPYKLDPSLRSALESNLSSTISLGRTLFFLSKYISRARERKQREYFSSVSCERKIYNYSRLFDFITVVVYWKTATNNVVIQLHTFRRYIYIYISSHTEITLKSPAILVLKHSSQGSFNSAIMPY